MGSDGRALVAQANVIARGRDGRGGLPLRDESVHLIVTSPPYLWKRKYAIAGTGEMGNEANWRLFLDNLWAATDEMLRVLKPTGSIFVNLGDTRVTGREPKWLGIPLKSRLLLPERYRIGCQDRYAPQGVIVRQVNIWEKVNGLPESVTDRTRDSHEDIVHIAKPDRAGRYYSAVDEVREPQARPERDGTWNGAVGPDKASRAAAGKNGSGWQAGTLSYNPLGKLPGSVWAIPSEPLRLPDWLGIQHYAAFPSELPRRIILGWSPPGICVACDQGRWPVVDRQAVPPKPRAGGGPRGHQGFHAQGDTESMKDRSAYPGFDWQATILGYACRCTPFTDHPGTGESSGMNYAAALAARQRGEVPDGWGQHMPVDRRPKVGPWREYHLTGWQAPPTRPAVVLDCFGGVGTSAMVARAFGRVGLSFDLSFPYSLAARWRVTSDHAAKAISRTNLERQQVLL